MCLGRSWYSISSSPFSESSMSYSSSSSIPSSSAKLFPGFANGSGVSKALDMIELRNPFLKLRLLTLRVCLLRLGENVLTVSLSLPTPLSLNVPWSSPSSVYIASGMGSGSRTRRSSCRRSLSHCSFSRSHIDCVRSASSSWPRVFFWVASSLSFSSCREANAPSRSFTMVSKASYAPLSIWAICCRALRTSFAFVVSSCESVSLSVFALARLVSRFSTRLFFESSSRRKDKISETREACRVGVNRRGSRAV